MSKALIVGAAGFVGSYLARELKNNHGMEVHATKLTHEQLEIPGVAIHDLNILNKDEIVALLYEVRPDYIFHLAAQSSVSVAWKNPGLTIDINVKGSVNLMDAVRELFYKPRVLLIGSVKSTDISGKGRHRSRRTITFVRAISMRQQRYARI